MAAPNFNAEKAAMALVDALLTTDIAAAEKWEVSRRTILNWRKRLDTDPEFARLFQEKRAAVEKEWADELPAAIRASVDFIKRSAQSTNVSDPDMLHSVAGALKILTETAAMRQLLDARLAPQARPNGAGDRKVGPSGSGSGR